MKNSQNPANTPTPTPTSTKRELSVGSTPSPLSTAQPPKKVVKHGSADADEPLLAQAQTESLIESTCTPQTTSDTQMVISAVMSALNVKIEEIKSTITDQMNSSLASMAQTVADIINASYSERISAVEDENKRLHDQVVELRAELESLKVSTERSRDTMEQYSRRNCLRIAGVPEPDDASIENTDEIILDIAKQCDVQLHLQDIDRSHRLKAGKPTSNQNHRPRDIIVKFTSYRARNAFYWGKSSLKICVSYKNVYINEDLTKNRADILKTARQLVKNKNSNATSAWSRDGRIFVKYADGTKQLVTSKSELVKNN